VTALSRARAATSHDSHASCARCGRSTENPIVLPETGRRPSHFCSASCVLATAAEGRQTLRAALEQQRNALLHALEQERASRVIALIHRVELGEGAEQFITIEDSEEILNDIRLIPDETPIDLILHCPGGIVLAAEQIALALGEHSGKVTAIVPHYAMSGATLLCLAADEILMDPHSVLGPLDPQIGNYPAPSLVKLLATKPMETISDEMLVLGDIATKALHQTRTFVTYLLKDRMEGAKAVKLAEFLTGGYLTHDSPLIPEQLQRLGLPVRVGVPPEVYALLRLHKLSHPRPVSAPDSSGNPHAH
jgi:ClpP class serine protease